MKTIKAKISDLKVNADNPRYIKDEKFNQLVKSIKELPQMLEIRPIVVNEDMVVLGGNMRLRACQKAGLKEVPIIKASDLTIEQQQEFIIKDNVGFGSWDWDVLANEWDIEQLEDWGLELPGFNINADEFNTDFNLDNGDKEPYQQMTFTLADEQAEEIKTAIENIKQTDDYKYCETFGNENTNGNALYLICKNG